MAWLIGAPLRISGILVGTADIAEDGEIRITMTTPNPYGREIAMLLERGLASGLSVSPIMIPAEPAASIEDAPVPPKTIPE